MERWAFPLLLSFLLWHGPVVAAPQVVGGVRFGEVAIHPVLSAAATVVSLNRSGLAAETSGRILRIHVRVGDRVRRGEALVELDCRGQRNALKSAEIRLDRARAALDLAERELLRARRLAGSQNVPEELVERRENAVIQARADVETAAAAVADTRLEVDRCVLEAPFDGIVLERLAGVGELAVPGTPLLRLLDGGALEVVARVPVSLAGPAAGDEIWLEVDERTYPLRIRTWVDVVDTRSRTRELRLLFVDEAALPGSAGRLRWRSKISHVPASLVVRRGERLGVFVIEAGRARFLALPGVEEGQPAPAPALPLDALLVREGRHGLEDGQVVTLP